MIRRILAASWFGASLVAASGLARAASPAAALEADCAERTFGGGKGITVHVTCRKVDGDGVTMVEVSGDIEPGDDRFVRQALLAVESEPVYVSLSSNGGNLQAGIEIGRAIWFREAATVVEDAVCASACALAWLAGRPRFMAADASIGFHAPWLGDENHAEASTAGSAEVGGYLRDLGLISAAIRYINEPGPDEMRWLTMDDADELNIAVRPWAGEEAVVVAEPPPPGTPVAAGASFRDCPDCPEMVVVPAGRFLMGSADDEAGHQPDESPRHEVRIGAPFAVGRFEVTFAEWDACVAGAGCDGYTPDDQHWGRGPRPVVDVSWEEAKSYVDWLSRKSGSQYRLLTEAEWEYSARAGTATPWSSGEGIDDSKANYAADKTVPVGSYEPNGFGLYDMHGNVWEWVQDCYAESYRGAPGNGGAVSPPGCAWRIIRGGGWNTATPENMRAAFRFKRVPGTGRDNVGFRVARSLGPTASMGGAAP